MSPLLAGGGAERAPEVRRAGGARAGVASAESAVVFLAGCGEARAPDEETRRAGGAPVPEDRRAGGAPRLFGKGGRVLPLGVERAVGVGAVRLGAGAVRLGKAALAEASGFAGKAGAASSAGDAALDEILGFAGKEGATAPAEFRRGRGAGPLVRAGPGAVLPAEGGFGGVRLLPAISPAVGLCCGTFAERLGAGP